MHILIVANHYAVCSARYAAAAFTRQGHEVRHIGPAMGRQIWGIEVPEQYVWEPDEGFLVAGKRETDMMRMMRLDGRRATLPGNLYTPDFIIVMDSDPALLDLQALAPDDVPVVVWGVDNHVRDYRRPKVRFDHYFLAHKRVSVMEWLEAGMVYAYTGNADNPIAPDDVQPIHGDMTWLPCAYDPVAFPPSPIPWEQRKYDVCCLGVMYDKRWELVNAMRAAGMKVFAGTGLVYDAYRDAHHNSRVALVSSVCGDLPIRLFEGAGMGCAVLCDPLLDLEDPWFRGKGSPFLCYRSIEEAVYDARYLQQRSDKAAEGQIWAASHTWDVRAQVIVDWFNARGA